MKLSAPTMVVFLISLVLAILAIFTLYGGMDIGLAPVYWALLGYIVLAAGNLLKGI
jgi:hypothetical protein